VKDWTDDYGWIRTGLYRRQTPVFHATRGWDGKRIDGDIFTIPARCGLALDQWSRETGARYHDSTMIFRGHADKFARPCRRCYPEAR
jgi:hypothetical protein